jgi:epimerase transport system membrane fusion protein
VSAVTPAVAPKSLDVYEKVHELSSTAATGRAILFVIGFGVFGVGLWSGTARLSEGAVAEGLIAVESTRKTIQHLEGGIVDEIHVTDGDYVKAGQVLVRLDAKRSRLMFANYEDKYNQDLALMARLMAERDDRDKVTFDPSLEQQAQLDPGTALLLEAQRQQFQARRTSEQGKVELYGQKIEELKREIEGLQAQVKSKDIQLNLLADELQGSQSLYKKGLEQKTRVLALQRSSQDLIGARAQNLAQVAADQVAIGETEMEILQSGRTFHEDVVEKLRVLSSDLADVRDRMATIQESMDRLVVRAPLDGQVVGLSVHTVGGVVSPGEKLMDLIPAADKLVVEARIPPQEIRSVRVGLPAEVRLTALRQRTAPTLVGTVTAVSTDVLTDQASHLGYYSARIEIPVDQLATLGKQKLVAGMPAEILVKNGERTVLEYIFAPITDALFRSFRQQ